MFEITPGGDLEALGINPDHEIHNKVLYTAETISWCLPLVWARMLKVWLFIWKPQPASLFFSESFQKLVLTFTCQVLGQAKIQFSLMTLLNQMIINPYEVKSQ